jgi:hypothetical protein
MSVNVAVDHSKKIVITTYWGEVTDADVALQITQIKSHAPYASEYCVITDFTQVTQFNISSQAIRSVAEAESPLGGAKRVMVAPSDVAYGSSRMFQSLASQTRPNIAVVRSLKEAYARLGIDGEE